MQIILDVAYNVRRIQALLDQSFLTDEDVQVFHMLLAGDPLCLFFHQLVLLFAHVNDGGHQGVPPAFNNYWEDFLLRTKPNSCLGVRVAKVNCEPGLLMLTLRD